MQEAQGRSAICVWQRRQAQCVGRHMRVQLDSGLRVSPKQRIAKRTSEARLELAVHGRNFGVLLLHLATVLHSRPSFVPRAFKWHRSGVTPSLAAHASRGHFCQACHAGQLQVPPEVAHHTHELAVRVLHGIAAARLARRHHEPLASCGTCCQLLLARSADSCH